MVREHRRRARSRTGCVCMAWLISRPPALGDPPMLGTLARRKKLSITKVEIVSLPKESSRPYGSPLASRSWRRVEIKREGDMVIRVGPKSAPPPPRRVAFSPDGRSRAHAQGQAQDSEPTPCPLPEQISHRNERVMSAHVAQEAHASEFYGKNRSVDAPSTFPTHSICPTNEICTQARSALPSEGEAHRSFVIQAAQWDRLRANSESTMHVEREHNRTSLETLHPEPPIRNHSHSGERRISSSSDHLPSTQRVKLGSPQESRVQGHAPLHPRNPVPVRTT
eukprot:763940-Hanusia_phi.AAC.2